MGSLGREKTLPPNKSGKNAGSEQGIYNGGFNRNYYVIIIY